MEKIQDQIRLVVKELYDVDAEIQLLSVPEGVEADYSCNVAMRLAGKLGKNPREVAEEIILGLRNRRLQDSTLVDNSISETKSQDDNAERYEVAGAGFINITLGAKPLLIELEREWSEKYGSNEDGKGRVAIVEYPSPNVAKPYSVGHLRPGNQGWAAKRLLEVTGWRVISDNHLGDSGTPFGIWATALKLLSSEDERNLIKKEDRLFFESEMNFDSKNDQGNSIDVYLLGRLYIVMKALLKKEDERGESILKDKVQDWLLKLESGDEEAVKLSKFFNEISLKHIHEVMDRLKISTDYEFGERYFVDKGKQLVEKYLDLGIFEKNEDGSVICKLDEFGIDVPLLVLKSNGAALYATTDLACMIQRAEEFVPEKVVHCVGAEQKFYFEQLFAMAKKIAKYEKGEVAENLEKIEFVHVWFGTIDQMTDGKREKMSSRKGVILMEELLDKAEARAKELTDGREVSDEDVKKIALGAIKFTDFAADKKTGILFDWDKIFALSGYSGPFCQYAAVRVNKIIELNRDFEVVDYSDYDWASEKNLLKLILEYPEVVKLAADKLEAHRVANYVFRLAQEFNRYYENVPVGKADDVVKSARLDLMKKVSQVLTSGLNLLGIEVPEKM